MATVVARKGGTAETVRARRYATWFGVPYIERCGRGLSQLTRETGHDLWLVVEQDGFYVAADGIRNRFHLNMAALRWREWEQNGKDYLSAIAAEMRPQRILDATYGIGSDALMLAAATRAEVVALEASWPLYVVGKVGLAETTESALPLAAAERIHLWHTDALTYLSQQESESFDLIYFDFMFTHPVPGSGNLQAVRRWGLQGGMTEALWREATRVCRGRIVRKERPFGAWLRTHPPDVLRGGKYSKVCYGVWQHA